MGENPDARLDEQARLHAIERLITVVWEAHISDLALRSKFSARQLARDLVDGVSMSVFDLPDNLRELTRVHIERIMQPVIDNADLAEKHGE